MKRVLVIGGSSGIGLALIEALKGSEVICISRRECPVAGVKSLLADVQNTDELERAFAEVGNEWGSVDACVYLAGCSMAAPIEYVETCDYKRLFEINLFGFIECVKRTVPLMKNGGGVIVGVSSMGGVSPIVFDSFYSASKAAMNMFARAANAELNRYGIRVVAALPGGTRTRFSFKRLCYEFSKVGDYAEHLHAAYNSLIKTEQTGMSANKCGKKLANVLRSPKTCTIVPLGLKNRALYLANKILPVTVSDKLAFKLYESKADNPANMNFSETGRFCLS